MTQLRTPYFEFRRSPAAILLAVLMLGHFAAPLDAVAQQARTVYTIGLFDYSAPDSARLNWWKAFQERMRELGYVEGQNVVFEQRWGQGQIGRLPALAGDLVRLQVNVIVTGGGAAALAARKATSAIPIVMATGPDPVALGLVSSLGRPGGNLTGVTSVSSELSGKRLELTKELIPRVSRVALLSDPANPVSPLTLRDTERAAKSLGIAVQDAGVRSADDLEAAFSAMAKSRTEAVIVVQGPSMFPERRRVAALAVRHRLPTVVGSREYAEAGGLMSYGTDYPDLFRRAAGYVDRILRGARPADLPVEQPTKFELVINLRTAKALGLTIPQSVLIRADEVIQ